MKIVKMKNVKFGNKEVYTLENGYALYEEGKGYVAFKDNKNKYGFNTPYSPQGGRKALKAILDAGSFTSFEGMEFINPIA